MTQNRRISEFIVQKMMTYGSMISIILFETNDQLNPGHAVSEQLPPGK